MLQFWLKAHKNIFTPKQIKLQNLNQKVNELHKKALLQIC